MIIDASHLASYQPYHFDFSLAQEKRKKDKPTIIQEYVLSLLNVNSIDICSESNQSSLWGALCCIPHIRPMDKTKCKDALRNTITKLAQLLPSLEDPLKDKVLFILACAVIDLCIIFEADNIEIFQSQIDIMDLLRNYSHNQHALLIGDIFFKLNKTNENSMVSAITLDEVYPLIKKNLSSPFSKIRLLTLRILSMFSLELPQLDDKLYIEQVGVFRLCLRTEIVPVTISDYREKIKCLQHLEFNGIQHNIPKESCLTEVPLLYLISMLYANFRLLWEPVMELIRSYAYGMDKKSFWKTYVDHLKAASNICQKLLTENKKVCVQTTQPPPVTADDCEHVTCYQAESVDELFSSVYNHRIQDVDRPDYVNFREQAWKAMHLFADRAEIHSRELTPLFLNFMEREYYPSDVFSAPTQDIRRRSEIVEDSTNQEDVVENDRDDGDDSQSDDFKKGLGLPRQKHSVTQTLLAHLELFAKFKGPKSLFKEPELRKLYTSLLSHKYGKVQKTVLQCIFAYKHKYLTPYQDHFKLLMDDKTFREEITLFNIDPEHGVVEKNHRAGLIPILMRILYGKMLSKAKAGCAQKRSVILRFLAGSEESELGEFIDLVIEPCKHLLKDTCSEMLRDVQQSLDLRSVLPLKKIHSMIDTIAVIFNKLGHMLTPFLPMMLHLLISLTATFTEMLELRDQILPYNVNQLKTLRPLGVQCLLDFFMIFDSYPFSAEEINCIFEAAVWPQIARLPNESITSPTTLLKMIHKWSLNPRYFGLLAKHHPDDKKLTVLPFVFELLKSKLTTKPVLSMVLDIVENLLVIEDFEASDNTMEIKVEDRLDTSIAMDASFHEPPTYGTKLVFPHIATILAYLKSALSSKDEKESLPLRELNILSRISMFVTNEHQCSVLVSLLLPYLKGNDYRNQNVELDLLRTVRNVMKQTTEPSAFLGSVSKLLYTLTYSQSRVLIIEIFFSMAQKDETLKTTAETIAQLNAWDKRHVEEPDFTTRFKAFTEMSKLIKDCKQLDMRVLTPLIYNCFFFISKVDEMSLRDNSVNCLQNIIQKLASGGFGEEMFNSIVIHKYMPAIKEGIKLKNEVSRGEIVMLLRDIVRLFPDHPRFSDMTVLLDEDMEKDFFENIKHIQIHRRGRALRRLAKHCTDAQIGYGNLYQYFLPLASAMVFDQSLAKDQNFVVEAINTIRAITSQLPWKFYSVILRQYLKLLTFSIEWQKVAVKLVVAVLDAFHFDLTLSRGVECCIMFKKGVELEGVMESAEKTDDIKNDSIKEDKILETVEGEKEEDEEIKDESQEKMKKEVALASRIHHTITNSILPQLFKSITRKVRTDDEHRSVRKNMADDNEVLRVPIALAMVKLLQSLPEEELHQYLPNVVIKVCQMLKSRSLDIREVTRDTLVKILQSLGVNYFSFIIKELKQTLTRGYQLHVLAYTVNLLIRTMIDQLKPGDLDCCIQDLTEVFNSELFGDVAEEKDVAGIVVKLLEAKSTKSYDSYQLVSQKISQSSLTPLILPLKEVLDNTHSHHVILKVQEVLRRLEIGFLENSGIPDSAMLIFIHGLATESLPLVTEQIQAKSNIKGVRDSRLQPLSTYLLPETPKRSQKHPQMSLKTNVHIIVEFGLQLFYLSLKKFKYSAANTKHIQMLDPFVVLLVECLNSRYTKMITCALRCFSRLLKFPLPSWESNLSKVNHQLFILLRNYAHPGAGKGENFELVVACFKAVTVLVHDGKGQQITDEQLQVLLSYVEEDIHDHTRQATAFSLLKAILTRQLMVPEMHDVIKKVAELSIRSEMHSVRVQCRQVVVHFLLDYPLGNKLKRHLEFYIGQLSFHEENGRVSALEMLATMFSSFPQKTLDQNYGLFFIPLSTRLVNDESAKCRKLVALAIKALLQKLDVGMRDSLFAIVTNWLNDRKVMHQRLAAQVCGIFIEAEGVDFDRRIAEALPLIGRIISEQRFKMVMLVDDDDDARLDQDLDHLLYHLLSTIAKMLHMCSIVRKDTFKATMNTIWVSVEAHLLHPHAWVRQVSAQLFGILFASWQPQEIVTIAKSPKLEDSNQSIKKKKLKQKSKLEKQTNQMEEEKQEEYYILTNFQARFRELAYRFCTQLKSDLLDQELSQQVIKNLVFIARVIHIYTKDEFEQFVPDSKTKTQENVDARTKNDNITTHPGDPETKKPELTWLMNKLCHIGRTELVKTPKKTLKRKCMVKWLGAVSVHLGKEHIGPFLPQIMKPMMREVSDKMSHSDSELRILCQEVLEMLKTMVGIESFTKVYASVQKDLNAIREGRKKKRALEAVANPETAAKRRMKKQLNKKESKKRKLSSLRPTYQAKKMKMKNRNKF
ncbi:small subunit processome component 20 homolog isoform X2 [Anneissia japonica]|uniref:small subunit processome component 20 homolog isoform X1 n=1 Tax=Anneissia japonica TaxID=1529436 RepID=UPI001425B637|nr:small subunit processome component 20 homolog isoform X1 [Anneissia japonica]XP_033113829.1 small subunit processome component 20 homolog isoform X2 [Anneissia japonica]